MTIDGNNIKTLYGLSLSYLGDYYNQPARKKTLSEPSFDAKDIKFESKEPVITLFGSYPDTADLFSKISLFRNLITSDLVHIFNVSEHSQIFSGVVTDGIRVDVFKTVVKITFKVTITE